MTSDVEISLESSKALQAYNSLAVESQAEFFVSPGSPEALHESLAWAKSRSIDVKVIGGGTNVLLSSRIPGLVVQPVIRGIQCVAETERTLDLCVGAGECWDEFVWYALNQQAFGLENLALIPGMVGAAPIQNIGAYGVEVAEFIRSVAVIDRHTLARHSLRAGECGFGYRTSRFKTQWKDQYIIESVTFQLLKTPQLNIGYAPLRHYLQTVSCVEEDVMTPRDVALAVKAIRQKKIPSPNTIPNAGSFFKNPVVPLSEWKRLTGQYPDIVGYETSSGIKIAAAWLIDRAGWKNKSLNGICVHEQQALVLTNPKRQPLAQILTFAEAIRDDIDQRFSVRLEIEPQIVF